MSQPNFTPRKKFILNDYRMPLPASLQPLPEARNPAQFMWEQKNNGKIVLKVNDGVWKQGAKNNHKEVELDYAERGVIFEALLEAANNKLFVNKQIPIRKKDFVFQNGRGQMSDSPITKVTIIVRRGEDGTIFWGYTKGDYKVEVAFTGPNDTVVYVKGEDGQRKEDRGILSSWSVRTYVKFHEPILNRMEEEGWVAPKPKNPPQGGGNNGGGNNNYQTPDIPDFDDDIDF